MIEFFSEPAMFTISILAATFIAINLLLEARIIIGKYTEKDSAFTNTNNQTTRPKTEIDVINRSSSIEMQLLTIKEDLRVLDRKINLQGEDISLIKTALQIQSSAKD